MATLGTMRTRIADELQIDATTYAVDIDRAIFSSIKKYENKDFWFLEAAPVTVLFTATSMYDLSVLVPDRSEIKSLRLHVDPSNGGMGTMFLKTQEELIDMDFDTNFTGQPCYWAIHHNTLMIMPKPQRTFTAQVWYSLRNSMTASASASSVWTTEAEEMIRLTAEVDILENRIKDYEEAMKKRGRLGEVRSDLDEATVARTTKRRTRPFL
jgi:hypothetical protein